ncbi:hypothetical protein [Streptomyces californicus]|uniref:hypothetical protein n=1 Tax=Streptomyces californicus TaxID=67351 RepID=UPI0012FEE281|nr:hypothetical protein [Streptomyces californicus]QRV59593.1 hypothetical protein I6J40_35765 [Streptomyces californicus]
MIKKPEATTVVSVDIGVCGVRVRADGRTGRAAWRALRREHPSVARAAALYVGVLGLLAAVIVTGAVAGAAW